MIWQADLSEEKMPHTRTSVFVDRLTRRNHVTILELHWFGTLSYEFSTSYHLNERSRTKIYKIWHFKILEVNTVPISAINRTTTAPIYWMAHWSIPSNTTENVMKIKYILIGINLYSLMLNQYQTCSCRDKFYQILNAIFCNSKSWSFI